MPVELLMSRTRANESELRPVYSFFEWSPTGIKGGRGGSSDREIGSSNCGGEVDSYSFNGVVQNQHHISGACGGTSGKNSQ
eukprot:6076126-Pleurochrysis_carterae.AAC.2